MRIALIAFLVLLPTVGLTEDWTPPKNPDAHAIMWEAKTDTQSGRYKVALAKVLWFHDNAVRLQPSLSAVRLSFALSQWLELGEAYPPALVKMKQVRDETEKRIRDEDKVRVKFADFHDFVALNKTLREEQRTAKIFRWLDETDEEDARRVFLVAKAALVKQKSYELYAKYIDFERDFKRIGEHYKMGLRLAKERFGDPHREFTEKTFLNSATTLVAILVQNDRKAEAEEAAEDFKTLVQDADMQKKLNRQMESALKGKVPSPWP